MVLVLAMMIVRAIRRVTVMDMDIVRVIIRVAVIIIGRVIVLVISLVRVIIISSFAIFCHVSLRPLRAATASKSHSSPKPFHFKDYPAKFAMRP
jgi:hypothetical protein